MGLPLKGPQNSCRILFNFANPDYYKEVIDEFCKMCKTFSFVESAATLNSACHSM